MKTKLLLTGLLVIMMHLVTSSQKIKVDYVNSFDNVNHPQVAYWFFAANMMPEEVYKRKIDSFAKYSNF